MGQWVLGAGLTALVALAHAQPAFAPHGGGGGFSHAPAMRPMSGAARGGWGEHASAQAMRPAAPVRREAATGAYGGGYGNAGRYGATPMHVADQGGWREGGGERGGDRGGNREPAGGAPYGNGFGGSRGGPITPVSAQTREVPHPPADSPVRTGSIREDVARYNEERGAFRPFPRGGGDVPRPPMPSPYRN